MLFDSLNKRKCSISFILNFSWSYPKRPGNDFLHFMLGKITNAYCNTLQKNIIQDTRVGHASWSWPVNDTSQWCLKPVSTQWASCQIRKIAGAHAPGMPGTFSPSPQVSDPGVHHGTCVTHVPWCMPGSLTNGSLWNRRRGETFPAFPAHAPPAILRIW